MDFLMLCIRDILCDWACVAIGACCKNCGCDAMCQKKKDSTDPKGKFKGFEISKILVKSKL